jgi:DNA polymerase I-like protein with 3'-5' exonuclease and polymerase domains
VSLAYTNLVRYTPEDDLGEYTSPDPAATKACLRHLKADIEKIKPTKIVVLGGALRMLIPTAPKMSIARGQHFKHDTLGKIFATYHPKFILKKQNLYEQWRNDLQLVLGSDSLLKKENRWSKPWDYRLLTDIDEIEEYVDMLLTNPKIKIISCDTETKNLNKRYDNILGMFQFCHDGINAVAIPYHHTQSGFTLDEYKRLDAALIKLFTHPNPKFKYWVFHNMEFDFRMLMNFGLGITKFNRPLMDTMTMAYCQDENRGKSGIEGPYRLESLIRDYLKVEKYGDDQEIAIKRKQGRMLEIDIERLAAYGCGDVVYTYRLYYNLLERAKREDYKEQLLLLSEYWFEPVVRMNAIMGSNGFWVDIEQLRLLNNKKDSPITKRMKEIKEWWPTSKFAKRVNNLMRKRELGGKMKSPFGSKGDWIFDIDKQIHKQTLFFDVMGLEPMDFGKGKRKVFYGDSKGDEIPTGKLDKHFQEKYAAANKEVEMLQEHSGLKKLATSYVKSIYEFLDPRNETEGSKDQRVRPSFWVTTTDTGRSSCTDPNLQQVPRADNWAKKQIKNMYAAEPGTALIQLDFMTSEVRWWGILSKCKALAAAFASGKKARMRYHKLSAEYSAAHPKMKYPVLDAGVSLLDASIEDLKDKHPDKALKVAKVRLTTDAKFKELCAAKKKAGIEGDLHKSTASQMYQVAIEKVTKNQRNDTKAIVFGSMFGRGAKAIAQQLGIANIEIVRGRIADFFKQFVSAEEWFYETEDFAEDNGYVESPIGRRRRLITFKLGISDKQEIARAKRVARNSPIQGISSDGAFLGSAMFCDWLIESGKWHVHPDKSCWLIQDVVHDSCVVQVPIEDIQEAIEALQPFFTSKLMKRMTKIWGVQFNIPLEVDFEVGLKWGDMEPWDGTQLHLGYLMNRIHKKEEERMKEAA